MGILTTAVLTAAGLLAAFAPVHAVPGPGTVGYRFEKRLVRAEEYPHLARRQAKTISAGLDNYLILYFINCTVGTPPQPFSLQLDTGSSDIWFPSITADICQMDIRYCPVGTFDAGNSSTFSQPDLPTFQIAYVDGTQVQGVYISDVLTIGETELTNMTMAAALTSVTGTGEPARGIGIMGIGFQSGESSNFGPEPFTYPNVIDVMKAQGHINALAYSLWLDDVNANTGVILFGGVDTEKYIGDLVTLPIQIDEQSGTISSFTVAWTGLTVIGGGQVSDISPSTPQPAILDCGTTNTLLPDEIANAIFNGVGVLTDPSYGNVVPCSLANDDLTFSFQFGGQGGPTVNVSLSEFVIPLVTTDGSQPEFRNGELACSFAVTAAGSNPILFGDSFLRSAYVVYDLENEEIGIAQTDFDSTPSDTNVQVISVGGSIPNVASTASLASVIQTFTGIPAPDATASASGQLGGGTTRSATFNLSPTDTSSTASGGSSSTSNAANANLRAAPLEMTSFVAAGVVMAGLLFGGGLLLF